MDDGDDDGAMPEPIVDGTVETGDNNGKAAVDAAASGAAVMDTTADGSDEVGTGPETIAAGPNRDDEGDTAMPASSAVAVGGGGGGNDGGDDEAGRAARPAAPVKRKKRGKRTKADWKGRRRGRWT